MLLIQKLSEEKEQSGANDAFDMEKRLKSQVLTRPGTVLRLTDLAFIRKNVSRNSSSQKPTESLHLMLQVSVLFCLYHIKYYQALEHDICSIIWNNVKVTN